MKYLGTLLSTQQEEVINAHGIKKRLTTVRRSVQRTCFNEANVGNYTNNTMERYAHW
jgi:hypothetical protein